MHKIGLHTINTSSWGINPQDLQDVKDWGFDCVDYNGFNDVNSKLFTWNDEEFSKHFETIKANTVNAGVEIGQTHAPWRTGDRTKEQQDFMISLVKRSIEGTAIMGCNKIIVHPLMPYEWNDMESEEHMKETYEANKYFLLSLAPHARKHSVTVCIENMPSRALSVSKLTTLYDLLEELNQDCFGLCLDTGHALITEDSPADVLRKCKKWVRALHVHDNHGSVDSHIWPFLGVADWVDFSKAYNELEGVTLSSETGCSFKFPKESKELMKNAMKHLAAIFRSIAEGEF